MLTVSGRAVVEAIRALLDRSPLLGPSLALSQGSCVTENRCRIFGVAVFRGCDVLIRIAFAEVSGLKGSVEAVQ